MLKRLTTLATNRWLVGVLVAVILINFAWSAYWTRFVRAGLGNSGYSLKYTVSWGSGMTEHYRIYRQWSPFFIDSGNFDVFFDPLDIGIHVYQTADARFVYLGVSSGVIRLETRSGETKFFCHYDHSKDFTAIDEGSLRLPKMDTSIAVPSEHYPGLLYAGSFQVVYSRGNHQSGRGDSVDFKPPDANTKERPGLSGVCG